MKTKKIQIKDLQPGDKIKTYDPVTKQIIFKNVDDVWNTVVPCDQQATVSFNNGTVVECSINHPFMIVSGNSLTEKKPPELKVGDVGVSDVGEFISVCDVTIGGNNPINYIDITVEDTHTFFAQKDLDTEMVLTHNSQGGIRGASATLYAPWWHYEIETIMVLKNNKGTDDDRVRRLDYGILRNKLLFERWQKGENLTLFSPEDVPDLMDAFYADQTKFEELYLKYERDDTIRKRVVTAEDWWDTFHTERKETGRLYFANVDLMNDHGAFRPEIKPIKMSNLCLSGDAMVQARVNGVNVGNLPIKTIADSFNADDVIEVLSWNEETKEAEYQKVKAASKTSDSAQVIKVTDSETGCFLICTPDHRIYTKNRGYVMAKELETSDELCIDLQSSD